ncbi:hypothetical protein ACJX0J_021517, partial [Zea mays]
KKKISTRLFLDSIDGDGYEVGPTDSFLSEFSDVCATSKPGLGFFIIAGPFLWTLGKKGLLIKEWLYKQKNTERNLGGKKDTGIRKQVRSITLFNIGIFLNLVTNHMALKEKLHPQHLTLSYHYFLLNYP